MCEESWYSLKDCTITVDAVQVSLGVPYNDDFSVEVRWNVENNHQQHQQHRRQQHFQKKPMLGQSPGACWQRYHSCCVVILLLVVKLHLVLSITRELRKIKPKTKPQLKRAKWFAVTATKAPTHLPQSAHPCFCG